VRRAARVDANQEAIVKALRDYGCSVLHLHAIGQGCPDILVGYRGINYLMELKDGQKTPSERRLTADEETFFNTWNGQVAKIESIEEAISYVVEITP